MTCKYYSCGRKNVNKLNSIWIYRRTVSSLNLYLSNNQPFGSSAVHNVTSGHSDSWRRPCQVPPLSRMRWATCALQDHTLVLHQSHRRAPHGFNKNIPETRSKILFHTHVLAFCLVLSNPHYHLSRTCVASVHKYSI